MKNASLLPFGLLFEEPTPLIHNPFTPSYDEDKGLSFVLGQDGQLLPFVIIAGHIGTATSTKESNETADEDPQDSPVGTKLLAESSTEFITQVSGTITMSANDVEDTDSDPGEDKPTALTLFGTETETFQQQESPDSDPQFYFDAWSKAAISGG